MDTEKEGGAFSTGQLSQQWVRGAVWWLGGSAGNVSDNARLVELAAGLPDWAWAEGLSPAAIVKLRPGRRGQQRQEHAGHWLPACLLPPVQERLRRL